MRFKSFRVTHTATQRLPMLFPWVFFFKSALQKVKADRAIKGSEKWVCAREHVFHRQDRIRKNAARREEGGTTLHTAR